MVTASTLGELLKKMYSEPRLSDLLKPGQTIMGTSKSTFQVAGNGTFFPMPFVPSGEKGFFVKEDTGERR